MKILSIFLALGFIGAVSMIDAKPKSTYESRPKSVTLGKSSTKSSSGEIPFDSQDGIASWYGYDLHGSKTATGGRYNQNALTAAHRTLPFGTRVLVVNLKNEKSVEVSINDRGPYIKGRIIDLSLAAAKKIGLVSSGIAPVRIEVIE